MAYFRCLWLLFTWTLCDKVDFYFWAHIMSKLVTPYSKIMKHWANLLLNPPCTWPPLLLNSSSTHLFLNALPCKSCKSAKIQVCLPFTGLLLQQTRGTGRGCAADNSSCLLAFFRAIIYQKTPGEFPALSPGSSVADRFTEVTHRYTHNTRVTLYKHPGAQ